MSEVNVVVGMQYGDEGKGKLVDFLAAKVLSKGKIEWIGREHLETLQSNAHAS